MIRGPSRFWTTVPAQPPPKAAPSRERGLRRGQIATKRLTLREKVLVALAWAVDERTGMALPRRPVEVEHVVVKAWKLWPSDFGLRNYPQPDASRVLCKFAGSYGLVRLGLASRTRPGVYELTPKGRDIAVSLARWESAGESAGAKPNIAA